MSLSPTPFHDITGFLEYFVPVQARFERFIRYLVTFLDRPWFIFLVSLSAGLDAFILVIPVEPLLIASVLARRRQWALNAFWCAMGSALGALALGAFVVAIGADALPFHLSDPSHGERTVAFVRKYGLLGIGLVAVSVVPPQPAIIFGALAKLPVLPMAGVFFAARLSKYLLLTGLAAFAPQLLLKVGVLRRAIEKVGYGTHWGMEVKKETKPNSPPRPFPQQ